MVVHAGSSQIFHRIAPCSRTISSVIRYRELFVELDLVVDYFVTSAWRSGFPPISAIFDLVFVFFHKSHKVSGTFCGRKRKQDQISQILVEIPNATLK
jgi:hypothetical protein